MTAGRLVLIRHGETEWSRSGRHTGITDIPLTANGEERAASLRGRLADMHPALILCSPLGRARRTAELAGMWPAEIDDDLLEWDYGAWEGRTTAEIRQELHDPEWTVWQQEIPSGASPGEQPEDVAVRAQRVIRRCAPLLADGATCVLVAHGHVLRILTATWLGLPARDGRLWVLDAGAISMLGFERTQRAIVTWNC